MLMLQFLPERASAAAAGVDHLFFFLLWVSAFFSVLIFGLIFYFAMKYRRRSPGQLSALIREPMSLEVTWIVIPFILTIVIFLWGAILYTEQARPPANAEEIFVVGKQWMWKLQHPEGNREINELHIPVGRPIKLVMTSEDVIHDFFVPAFRVKKDVLPGRYTSIWFLPNKTGTFHFFCSQYCGTEHSRMNGWVTVMEPAAYEKWLGEGGAKETMAASGKSLFQRLECDNCHQAADSERGPSLVGVFGKTQPLEGGKGVVADERYLRDSILDPRVEVAAGFQPLMPTYKGQVNEEQLLELIAYIKSLAAPERKKQ
jgi:cytochrome c oxidase subunit II